MGLVAEVRSEAPESPLTELCRLIITVDTRPPEAITIYPKNFDEVQAAVLLAMLRIAGMEPKISSLGASGGEGAPAEKRFPPELDSELVAAVAGQPTRAPHAWATHSKSAAKGA